MKSMKKTLGIVITVAAVVTVSFGKLFGTIFVILFGCNFAPRQRDGHTNRWLICKLIGPHT